MSYLLDGASLAAQTVKKKKKKSLCNAGEIRDAGLISDLGRTPGGGHENSMDRGAWWPIVHRIAKSRTQLK